jgi:hypothetical protein
MAVEDFRRSSEAAGGEGAHILYFSFLPDIRVSTWITKCAVLAKTATRFPGCVVGDDIKADGLSE